MPSGSEEQKTLDRTLIAMLILSAIGILGVAFRFSTGATTSSPLPPAAAVPSAEAKRVAVIINMDSIAGASIGSYYVKARGIPRENIIAIHTVQTEEVDPRTYVRDIEKPILDDLHKSRHDIDFLVFTKGTPIRITGTGISVDGSVATADSTNLVRGHTDENVKGLDFIENPYFEKSEGFSHAKFGFWLPTRLDGYTVEDAESLVDNSLRARAEKGPFVCDDAENRNADGYGFLQRDMGRAADILKTKGFSVIHDTTANYIDPGQPMAGYATWGSNDSHFSLATYHKLTFKPGALCETFVSTSGRTFLPADGGQSLIADLIHQGVTGIKGYVSEPYTFALARPSILFDRYVSGYNLAESFWMASPTIRWKEVVIGDPLCRPYGH